MACANARAAYQRYLAIIQSDRWQNLTRQGARSQRLLWASTSAKDPALPDVFYVEELIGPDTVTTLPLKTLDAFREHGKVRESLTETPRDSVQLLDRLQNAGAPFRELTETLLTDGLKQFSDAFGVLLRLTGRVSSGVPGHDPADQLRIRLFKELYTGRRSA